MTENSADVHIDVLLALRVRPVRMNGVGCLRLQGESIVSDKSVRIRRKCE
ncbi:hypothetical protein LCGC14_1667680 [marine sediment metagenome]|uniref:Uncharacterized protein n=1 Tax=marine sediment metagenome TaxID=412755 RepID=A0A0F9HS67_9ZZZZ